MTAPVAAADAVAQRKAAKTAARKAAAPSGATGGRRAGDAAPASGGGRGAGSGQRGPAPRSSSSPALPRNKLLLAEFVLCAVMVGLSPLTDKHRQDSAADWMARASAVCGLFFLLALLSAGGPRSVRVAQGFGGLVTLTLLVSERSVFVAIADRFNRTPRGTGDTEPIPSPPVESAPATPAPRPGRAAPA